MVMLTILVGGKVGCLVKRLSLCYCEIIIVRDAFSHALDVVLIPVAIIDPCQVEVVLWVDKRLGTSCSR